MERRGKMRKLLEKFNKNKIIIGIIEISIIVIIIGTLFFIKSKYKSKAKWYLKRNLVPLWIPTRELKINF